MKSETSKLTILPAAAGWTLLVPTYENGIWRAGLPVGLRDIPILAWQMVSHRDDDQWNTETEPVVFGGLDYYPYAVRNPDGVITTFPENETTTSREECLELFRKFESEMKKESDELALAAKTAATGSRPTLVQ